MSKYISDITSRIFLVLSFALLFVVLYFAISTYYVTVNGQLQAISQRAEIAGSRIAAQLAEDSLYLQSDLLLADGEPDSLSLKRITATKKYLSSLVNSTSNDEAVLWIFNSPRNTYTKIIGTAELLNSSPNAQEELPVDLSGGIVDNEKNYTISAFTPLQNLTGQTVGLVEYKIVYRDTIIAARKLFYRNSAFGILFLCIVSFIVHRYLKQILHHERISKEKLEEYVNMIDRKNKELEKLSFVLGQSENLIVLCDAEGKIEWISKGSRRRMAYSSEDLQQFTGKRIDQVSHNPQILSTLKKIQATKEAQRYEAKSFDREGREMWTSTTVTPVMNSDGEIGYILFLDTDITALKLAEQEIAKLAALPLENTNPVIRLNTMGEVLFGNQAAEPIIEYFQTTAQGTQHFLEIKGKLYRASANGSSFDERVEVNGDIFRLHFTPIRGQHYINVHGEKITDQVKTEEEIRSRNMLLEQFNHNFTDSLNYASRIQKSLLPSEDAIRRYFKDAFVLSKPKDILSGDFYWIHETIPGSELLLALVDCTGHGVPGAMMSIIAHSILTEIVSRQMVTDPSTILYLLNQEIIKTLRQKQQPGNDGLDISLCRINKKTGTIDFAGAYRPLFWMNGKLNVLKGDKMPVGGMVQKEERHYKTTTFQVGKGDCIYLFSDGFADQFGGPNGKKFLISRMREMIERNHQFSMQAQNSLYAEIFDTWKGSGEQVDDVFMIGVRF